MNPVAAQAARRQGVATLTAIALIGLVGATLVGMAGLSNFEFRRALNVAEDARLHQLLLAGGAGAIERSHGWEEAAPDEKWELSLPDELKANAAIKLRSRPLPEGKAEVAIEVHFGGGASAASVSVLPPGQHVAAQFSRSR